jgi:hypothetical protein
LKLGNPWNELHALLSKSRKVNSFEINTIKYKVNPFPETILSLDDQFTLVDTVMQIPIDSMVQIQIYIYKYREVEYLDIRQFRFDNHTKVFRPTRKGIRLPIQFLPQLLIRLNRIDINSKRRNNPNQFNLEL